MAKFQIYPEFARNNARTRLSSLIFLEKIGRAAIYFDIIYHSSTCLHMRKLFVLLALKLIPTVKQSHEQCNFVISQLKGPLTYYLYSKFTRLNYLLIVHFWDHWYPFSSKTTNDPVLASFQKTEHVYTHVFKTGVNKVPL